MQNDTGEEQEMKAGLCTTDIETRQTWLNQCTQGHIGPKQYKLNLTYVVHYVYTIF